ncbi:MAG: hypothetical protein ABI340_08260 [Nitrososphaera sp.]|jgi:hypothetical protein
MDIIFIEFRRCELTGSWDYTESDTKTYYEAKNEPAVLELWTSTGKRESYKFKKGSMVRISSNIIRFKKEDTK